MTSGISFYFHLKYWFAFYSRAALLFVTLLFIYADLLAQTHADSLNQIRIDSVDKIPLTVKKFKADESDIQIVLDTNSFILHSYSFTGIHLNNFFTPEFHSANVSHNVRIYDHGINSMPHGMSGFDDYNFLSPNKPIAEIFLNRGGSYTNSQAAFGDNFDLHLIFAENFRNHLLWNFSFDHDDYLGIYSNSLQKNTLFTTGVQYSGKKDQFHMNILYLDQRHTMGNNWGIASDSILTNPNYSVRESAPVINTIATTAIAERSIGFNMDFPFLSSMKLLNPKLLIKSFYTSYSFLYSDPIVDSTKIYYKPFLNDSFATNYLTQNIWTNSLSLQFKVNDKIESKFGIRYEHVIFDNETNISKYDLYQLEATIKYHLDTNYEFHALAHLKKIQNSFVPEIQLQLMIRDLKYFNSTLSAFIHSDQIPYIYQNLAINKKYVWQNNFENKFIQESGLSVSLNTTKFIKAQIKLSWSRFTDFVYLDTLSFPEIQSNLNKFSFQCTLPIHFKRLHFNSQFNYAVFSPDPARLTGWNSNHHLSLNRYLFNKVVHAEFGTSLKLYNYNYKLKFNPLIQLYYSSGIPNNSIYSVGLFMRFQVSEFQFSIDMENLDSFWIKERPSLVASYPFYDFFFKFGIHWKFLN